MSIRFIRRVPGVLMPSYWIAAALEQEQLEHFEAVAHQLGMNVLLELHDTSELEKCRNLTTPLWGVNNRNLRTFDVSLQQTLDLLPALAGKTVVTEAASEANPMSILCAATAYIPSLSAKLLCAPTILKRKCGKLF